VQFKLGSKYCTVQLPQTLAVEHAHPAGQGTFDVALLLVPLGSEEAVVVEVVLVGELDDVVAAVGLAVDVVVGAAEVVVDAVGEVELVELVVVVVGFNTVD